jgi:hypothetical protein
MYDRAEAAGAGDGSQRREWRVGLHVLDQDALAGAQRAPAGGVVLDRDLVEELQEIRAESVVHRDAQVIAVQELDVAPVRAQQVDGGVEHRLQPLVQSPGAPQPRARAVEP